MLITRRRWAAVGAALVLVTAVALPAWGDDSSFEDADDTGGALDVASARHGHVELSVGGKLLVHGFELHEAWANEVLAGSYNEITLYFNIDDDRHEERRLGIDVAEDGSLQAAMFAQRKGKPDRLRGYAAVWRTGDHGAELRFPPRLLDKGLGSYGWRMTTAYHDNDDADCGDTSGVLVVCVDRAPDSGRYRHPG